MNATRRKQISDIIELLVGAKTDIESAKDDEQEAYDSLPANFQEGEKGEAMAEVIASLDEAVVKIDEVLGELEEAMN